MSAFDLQAEIAKWRQALPRWQQYALRQFGPQSDLTEKQLGEVYQSMLAEHRLGEAGKQIDDFKPAIRERPREQYVEATVIERIKNLRGINALPSDQTVSFSPGLTVLYGVTASGKSGYGRLLAAACGDVPGHDTILPNVYVPTQSPQSADIIVGLAQGRQMRIPYQPRERCPELKGFRYFDSHVANYQLTQAAEVDIAPDTLQVFERLARVMTAVRSRLQEDVQAHSPDNEFADLFSDDTPAGRFVHNLGSRSDLRELARFCTVTQEEGERLSAIEKRIAELRALDLAAQAKALEEEERTVADLQHSIQAIEQKLSEAALQQLREAVSRLNSAREAAADVGHAQFQVDGLSRVGSATWCTLIEAAHEFGAEEQEARNSEYPHAGDICLFCHQPLSEAARALIARYWELLEGTAQSELEQATANVKALDTNLSSLDFDLLAEDRLAAKQIGGRDAGVLCAWRAHLGGLRKRRDDFLAILRGHGDKRPAALPEPLGPQFERLLRKIGKQRESLQPEAKGTELKELEAEKVALEDRKRLRDLRQRMEEHIARHQWAQRASRILPELDTARITMKHGQLFDKMVTRQYRERFREECKRLDCEVPVKVLAKGVKGRRQFGLAVRARQPCKPVQVLSEGEQRLVALAKFFTEVACDPKARGIILDDPANWLDRRHKELLTERLVEEASKRQVVLLTHDLVLLSFLKECADQHESQLVCHLVQTNAEGTPGIVSPNDGPLVEADYKNTDPAKEALQKARETTGKEQLGALEQGFDRLRRTCEVFVTHQLLKRIVTRYDERIRVGVLRDVVLPRDIVDRVVRLHERLSPNIGGHSHSNGFAAAPPSLADLQRAIQDLDDLIADYRKARKEKE